MLSVQKSLYLSYSEECLLDLEYRLDTATKILWTIMLPTDKSANVGDDDNEEVENGGKDRYFVWEDMTNCMGTGGFGCRVRHMIQITIWNLCNYFEINNL